MDAYAYKLNGQWTEITGAFTTAKGGYPPGWAEGSTPAERAKAGVVAILEAVTDAAGHQRKKGEEIADAGGVPMRVSVFEELTLAERKAIAQVLLRQLRWEHEQGGFTTPAGPARSDDATQGKIQGALLLSQYVGAQPRSLDWELAPGVWATVSTADLVQIALAVAAHVQACFTHCRALSEAVEAAKDHAALTAIDISEGWPA